ncbi:MAG: hydantoinase B/oxoprolinase family protein [Alphaproteobacteria bacterium]|nr:hydantoinase B/oxoprolinase family protein [Alphaproteobacteria bacterium]
MSDVALDPLTLTVIWKNVLSIAEEIGITLRHTAYSEGVREGDDFSSAVFDARGRLVSQGPFSPGHLGSFPYVVRAVLDDWFPGESLRPGDAVLLNDSAIGTGHFPDTMLIMPVFLDGRRIGFVCNSAHQVDMGGAAPGSQKVQGVTEAYQEGLRILPIRFVRDGKIDEDLLRVVLGNVRMPDKVQGDLIAQHSANCSAAVRLERLFRDYGTATVERVYDEMMVRSEAAMRAALAKVPAGTYSGEDFLDDYGPDTPPVRIAIDITFDGLGGVTLDYSRSSDQVPAGLNSYLNFTRAYAVFAIKVFCNALWPQNDGNLRPIKVVAREGSFFNPRFPAPSGGRAVLQVRVFDTINQALAGAMPERAMGAFSHWSNPNIGGIDDRTGRAFVMYDMALAGYGGRHDCDGPEGLSPVMNCSNIPVEVLETHNPILVRRLEFITNSGGAGKHRGGCGLRKDIELRNSTATLSLLGDRHKFDPRGLFGGEPGVRAETILNPDRNARSLPSKATLAMQRGDVVSLRLSGAGGYGPPAAREGQAIARDIADGYITAEHAKAKYGYGPGD